MGKQAPESNVFRNRIVKHAEVDPAQLEAHPLNWRTHDDRQRYVLKGTMKEVGWVKNVIVNQRTGRIIDGHLRVSVAIERGESKVPVTYVDLSEEEEAMVLATLDPIVELAGSDQTKLEPLLALVETDDLAIRALLDEIGGFDGSASEAYDEEDREVREQATREAIVQYNIIFDNEEHQQVWYNFLRYLRRMFPDKKTVSERLVAYCAEIEIGSEEGDEDDD